jgi:ABC-type transport system substrate-binding protein
VTKQPWRFSGPIENRFISKVAGDKYGDQLYQNLVGTGPYKFVSFQRGATWFSPATTTIGAAKQRSKIVFRKVTESRRLAALESGQADFINASPSMKARLERHPRVRVDMIEGLEMYFPMMNVAPALRQQAGASSGELLRRCGGHSQKYF